MSFTAIALSVWCGSALARGDAHQDSDYDAAVFLRGLTDRWQEIDCLAAIETDILAETGAFYSGDALPCRFLSRAHAADARDPPRRHRSVTPEADRHLDKLPVSRSRSGHTPDALVPLEQAATAVETADRFIQTIGGVLG